MGLNFTPKAYEVALPEDLRWQLFADAQDVAVDDDNLYGEKRLPAGWWILPSASVAFILWIVGIGWIIAQL